MNHKCTTPHDNVPTQISAPKNLLVALYKKHSKKFLFDIGFFGRCDLSKGILPPAEMSCNTKPKKNKRNRFLTGKINVKSTW